MTVRIAGVEEPIVEARTIRFPESRSWPAPPVLAGMDERPLDVAAVRFGDDDTGPVLFLVATPPGSALPDSPAHGHASDNWRISLLGELPMGRTVYGPGDFRFQAGWRTYPSDNFAQGGSGGWTALLFGDQRGTRVRHVGAEPPVALEAALAQWIGIGGDQLDPDDACPPSTLTTSLGPLEASGRLDASFTDTSAWAEVSPGVRVVSCRMADPGHGPLLTCRQAAPGTGLPSSADVPADVVQIVVQGSCTVGAATLRCGDVHVHPSGAPLDVVAGADGLSDVLVVAPLSR